MDDSLNGLAALATTAIVLGYELWLALASRRHPGRLARSAHASLRQAWFEAISEEAGTEILAVQTLRNSMMSATMIASTATLALMGTLTLSLSSLHAWFADAARAGPVISWRLVMELVVLALLLASLLSSVMAVRYFNHASYIGGMPVRSEARRKWNAAGSEYARKAGLFYSLGLRQLVLTVPPVAAVLHPVAGVVVAVVAVSALAAFDRVPPME